MTINVTRSSMPPFEEYCEEIRELWDSHWLTNMGSKHQQLERELKQFLGCGELALFTNGHLALDSILRAMQLGEGEVITTPLTFISTANAIAMNGLKPVFCDVKPSDCTMDEEKIEALITEKTRAIVPVHVYGFPCAHEKIQAIADKHGLKVIYDAAHAFGVEVDGRGIGTLGDASMFSLHATKVFNAVEGGLATFRDPAMEAKLCAAQNFGLVSQEQAEQVGLNAKMSEFHAAMGLAILNILDGQIAARKALIEYYLERLQEIPGVDTFRWDREDVLYNYAYFPICVSLDAAVDRDTLAARLLSDYNVQARKYFYPIMSDFNCYRTEHDSADTPVAKDISRRIMTLPLFAELTHGQVDYICDAIRIIVAG